MTAQPASPLAIRRGKLLLAGTLVRPQRTHHGAPPAAASGLRAAIRSRVRADLTQVPNPGTREVHAPFLACASR